MYLLSLVIGLGHRPAKNDCPRPFCFYAAEVFGGFAWPKMPALRPFPRVTTRISLASANLTRLLFTAISRFLAANLYDRLCIRSTTSLTVKFPFTSLRSVVVLNTSAKRVPGRKSFLGFWPSGCATLSRLCSEPLPRTVS